MVYKKKQLLGKYFLTEYIPKNKNNYKNKKLKNKYTFDLKYPCSRNCVNRIHFLSFFNNLNNNCNN